MEDLSSMAGETVVTRFSVLLILGIDACHDGDTSTFVGQIFLTLRHTPQNGGTSQILLLESHFRFDSIAAVVYL